MEVFSFFMRSAFPVMALTSRAIICITLLSWAATCIGLFAEAAPAGSGTATCTIPSVREGEEATLTCTFENVIMTGAKAITVNAHGLNISGPGTDDALSVLVFKKSDTGWQQISLNSNFLLKNGTVISVHNILNVLVTIPKATEGYEGEYSCQLVGRGTPDPQSCHFLLDRVQVDYLNETSVLLYLELQNVGADSRKKKLMQRVDVGLQDAGEITKENFTLTPPQPSYTVTGLEYNTKYEMIIYQGPAQVPVTRTVCIPTVQNLTTSYVNTSCVRVDWKPSVCYNSIVNHTYRICYKKVVSGDNNCTDSEKPFTFINDPDTGAVYEISVQVMIDGKIIGVTTHKAVLKKAANTQGNGELKPEEIAGIVIGVWIPAAVAYLIIYCKCWSKKLKKETETHDQPDNIAIGSERSNRENNGNVAPTTSSGADRPEEIPLLENIRMDIPAPAVSNDTQPAGVAPDRVSGPENRPQDPLSERVPAEVHPIATPASGSINNEPAGATPNTSLALDVTPMEVPNSQEEHIVSTEPEVSSSAEAGHGLTPDSGFVQASTNSEEKIKEQDAQMRVLEQKVERLAGELEQAKETKAQLNVIQKDYIDTLKKSADDLRRDLDSANQKFGEVNCALSKCHEDRHAESCEHQKQLSIKDSEVREWQEKHNKDLSEAYHLHSNTKRDLQLEKKENECLQLRSGKLQDEKNMLERRNRSLKRLLYRMTGIRWRFPRWKMFPRNIRIIKDKKRTSKKHTWSKM